MISILIPVFNFDVRPFVKQLSEQCSQCQIQFEIICLDDGSAPSFNKLNKEVAAIAGFRYVESEVNLGRSRVRNALANMARYEHLLFLDCDGLCPDTEYIQRYLPVLHHPVVYGGRTYADEAPDDHSLYFHWYCGSNREAILCEDRLKTPYRSFMTNNFLVHKSVYEKIKMDERLSGYGHEDTLFALQLEQSGIPILHIKNPIEHIGIEPIQVFLDKTANAQRNLAFIMRHVNVAKGIKLVRYYQVVRSLGLASIISFLARLFAARFRANFAGPAPSLLWFDVWKLHLLHRAYSPTAAGPAAAETTATKPAEAATKTT